MIDLMSATQAAVFAALSAGVTLAPARDAVKQDQLPPFVQIGAIESSNEGDKEDQRELMSVEVHSIYRGSDRSRLLAIMHQVRAALDEQPIEADGVSFSLPTFISAAASSAGPDGVTYAAISTFEVYAEPA